MEHDLDPPTELYSNCKVCGQRVTLLYYMIPPEARGQCKGAPKTAELKQIAPMCECGAAKTGTRDFAPGHSSWCPVHD